MTDEKPPAPIRLAIIYPAYGGQFAIEHLPVALSLGWFLALSEKRFTPVAIGHVDENPVDKARNNILKSARDADADWVLMIDADTWAIDDIASNTTSGEQLLRMISEADRAGAAIAVAPVIRRKVPTDPNTQLMVYRLNREHEHVRPFEDARPEDLRALTPHDFVNSSPITGADGQTLRVTSRDRPVEIDFAATAIMAINLKHPAVADAKFAFTDQLSEDFEFCRQVRAAGGVILCDPRVRTAHRSKSIPLVF